MKLWFRAGENTIKSLDKVNHIGCVLMREEMLLTFIAENEEDDAAVLLPNSLFPSCQALRSFASTCRQLPQEEV